MNIRLPHIILLLLGTLLFTSCYTYQYVPEGDYVLYKNKVDIAMSDGSAVSPEVEEAMKNSHNYIRQKPNSKVLGIDWLRVSMGVYGIANPADSSFMGRYFRRTGQAPRIYDAAQADRSVRELRQLLHNKGCFGSTVTYDTAAIRRRDITIGYHITATPRYLVDEVNWLTGDSTVQRLLDRWASASPLHADEPYDQDKLAAERVRLVNNLRESGYYRATAELVTFEVDTTYSSTNLTIDVVVDSRPLHVYHINNIYVYPNNSGAMPGRGNTGDGLYDTLIYNYRSADGNADYTFVYSEPMSIRPDVISRKLLLRPAMRYRPRYINNAYNNLLSLRNFRYINIDFSESPASTDSLALVDAHVRLVNATRQRLSLSLELTNASPLGISDSVSFLSSGNLGFETALEYQNKNLFGGAEQLKVKGSLLFELPKRFFSGGGSGFAAFEAALDASLDIPVSPIAATSAWQILKPHTLISLGGSYQHRYYFKRVLANTSFGYTWSGSPRSSNQLLPIELTFVRMLSLDDDFATRLANISDLRIKYQYSSHFIMDARYDYTYTNQQYGLRRNFHTVHLSAESAGNLLYVAGRMFNAPVDSNGVREYFGVPFSQYVRLGGEWTHYSYLFRKSTLVTRLLVGAGLPYGNSLSMPYEKSFFGGGPTTMRAWQLRRLGPGSYAHDGDMLERVGDLQLVLNVEGRFPIVSIFEGAVFADMGNVWLLNASSEYTGGELKLGSLPREVAVGVGLGLRVNVSVATLRIDFAIPLYDPGYAESLRWRPPQWHVNQIVTNFGINYPF